MRKTYSRLAGVFVFAGISRSVWIDQAYIRHLGGRWLVVDCYSNSTRLSWQQSALRCPRCDHEATMGSVGLVNQGSLGLTGHLENGQFVGERPVVDSTLDSCDTQAPTKKQKQSRPRK